MKTRLSIFIVVLGLAAVAIGWVYESQLRSQSEEAQWVIPDNIDYFLTNLRYRVMTPDGELDYEFRSRRLEHRPLTDVSHIEAPTLQIYSDGERWQVDAREGQFQHRDNLLQLRHEVVMRRGGEQPLQLSADSLSFAPDRDLVSAESNILLRTDNAVIEADTAIFDLESGHYNLTRTRSVYDQNES